MLKSESEPSDSSSAHLLSGYEKPKSYIMETQSDESSERILQRKNFSAQITVLPSGLDTTADDLAITNKKDSGTSVTSKCCMKRHSIPKRYFITIMVFVNQFFLHFVQLNLSVTIIAMTSNTTVITENGTKVLPAEFQLAPMETGMILGVVNIGYIFALLGGTVSYKFGGATTMGFSALIIGLLELSSPFLFTWDFLAFAVSRIAVGVCDGFSYVASADMFAHWSPTFQRAQLSTYAHSGHLLSGALSHFISGYLAHTWGWRAVFYATGIILIIWSLMWLYFVGNDPDDDKFISEAEKTYIKSNIHDVSTDKVPIPWRSILSSKSVYALLNEFFCASWTASFIARLLPLYIRDMHNVSIKELGLISGLPMLGHFLVEPIVGYIADYLRTNVLSVEKVHKLFIFCGQFLVLVCLMTAVLSGDSIVCIVCFCLLRTSYSLCNVSYLIIPVDIAGHFAGIIKSLCLGAFKIGHMVSPLLVSYIVQNHSYAEWNIYIIFLSVISMYGVIMFLVFGSGKLQPWATITKNEDA